MWGPNKPARTTRNSVATWLSIRTDFPVSIFNRPGGYESVVSL
jgi:hypothetical protein